MFSTPPIVPYKKCVDWTCSEHKQLLFASKPCKRQQPVLVPTQSVNPVPYKDSTPNTVEDLTLDEDLLREVNSIEQSLVLEEERSSSDIHKSCNPSGSTRVGLASSFTIQPQPESQPEPQPQPQPELYRANSIPPPFSVLPNSFPPPCKTAHSQSSLPLPFSSPPSSIPQNQPFCPPPPFAPFAPSSSLLDHSLPFQDMDTSEVEEATVNSTSIQFATANSTFPIDSTAKVEHKSFSVTFDDGTEIRNISGLLKNCPFPTKNCSTKTRRFLATTPSGRGRWRS